jgi:lipopolysaccharide biosynthesis glycosyltransferase
MSELHLACAADRAYVAHSAAMLHSAITHGGAPLTVHYLHGPGFPRKQAKRLAEMFRAHPSEIVFHEIPDARLTGLPLDHRFGPAMWYRIFLGELLPDVTQLLYLDVDTIVMDRLDPLWDVALGDCYVAAVTNVVMEYHRHRFPALGLDPSEYFNSGVLMFNLTAMRAERFSQKLIEVVRTRGAELGWPDQDALNLLAAARRVPLHPRWNVMNSFTFRPQLAAETFGRQAVAEAMAQPAIRHFEGPGIAKPWHAGHDRPDQALYRRHRRPTPWPRVWFEGSPRERARRLAGQARRDWLPRG